MDKKNRESALRLAVEKGLPTQINMNMTPSTLVYEDGLFLNQTLELMERLGISNDKVVVELIESELVSDVSALKQQLSYCAGPVLQSR